MKTLITFISQYDPIGVEFVDTKQDDADGRKKDLDLNSDRN